MAKKWNADANANFRQRWGRSAHELGVTGGNSSCPDIWELENGDVAIIGTVLTAEYLDRLPVGVSIDPGESLVVIPREIMISARADIPDA